MQNEITRKNLSESLILCQIEILECELYMNGLLDLKPNTHEEPKRMTYGKKMLTLNLKRDHCKSSFPIYLYHVSPLDQSDQPQLTEGVVWFHHQPSENSLK